MQRALWTERRGRLEARPRRASAILVVALLFVFSASEPAAAQGSGRRPDSGAIRENSERHRSLDASERDRAAGLARSRATAELLAGAARSGREPLVGAQPRIELLRVERVRPPKGERRRTYRRRAQVFFYDYDADQLGRAIVDLARERVESVEVMSGIQLALSRAEVERAMALALGDAVVGERIRERYREITGRTLRDPDALEVAGFVYRADSMPGRNSPEAKACGHHRCAQLLIRTRDQVSIELPIVDLSRERVVDSRRFGEASASDSHHGHDHAH